MTLTSEVTGSVQPRKLPVRRSPARRSAPHLHTHLPGASWSPSTMPEVTLLHCSTGGPRLSGASRP